MRDNKKRYANSKIKIKLEDKENKSQEQPKHVVLQINDSNLASKSIYGGNKNG